MPKTPSTTWTKADAKRAEKMGWLLWPTGTTGQICASRPGGVFKADDEAARWVVDDARWNGVLADMKTCRKAVIICCGGAR